MNIHVICMNDSVEHAVVDNEDAAKKKMAELKEAHYKRNKFCFDGRINYETRCYWHIHTVQGE